MARRRLGRGRVALGRHRPASARTAQAGGDAPQRRPDGAAAGEIDPGVLGHLRVFECIGRGAFGEVYRAWDPRLDREVALKLLPADAAPSDSHASAIIEEGRLLARVRHPNVVTIYGAERIGDRIGLWMEFIQGQTLEQLVSGGKRFSDDEVIALGVELCKAAVSRAWRRPPASRHQGAERDGRRRRPGGVDGLRHRPRPGRRTGDRARRNAPLSRPRSAGGRERQSAKRDLQHRCPALSTVDRIVSGPRKRSCGSAAGSRGG